jgi:hypothetical protein
VAGRSRTSTAHSIIIRNDSPSVPGIGLRTSSSEHSWRDLLFSFFRMRSPYASFRMRMRLPERQVISVVAARSSSFSLHLVCCQRRYAFCESPRPANERARRQARCSSVGRIPQLDTPTFLGPIGFRNAKHQPAIIVMMPGAAHGRLQSAKSMALVE